MGRDFGKQSSKFKTYSSKSTLGSVWDNASNPFTNRNTFTPLMLEEKWYVFKNSVAFKGIIFGIIAIIVMGFYWGSRDTKYVSANTESNIKAPTLTSSTTLPKTKNVMIYVTGAVNSPGVVEIKDGSRVFQAIEMAGGTKENANISNCDMASRVIDGSTIYIPSIDDHNACFRGGSQANAGSANSNSSGGTGNIINLNIATQSELETLPGVGPSLATAIISYREENDGFNSVNDLRKVNGIGDKKFADLKELVSV